MRHRFPGFRQLPFEQPLRSIDVSKLLVAPLDSTHRLFAGFQLSFPLELSRVIFFRQLSGYTADQAPSFIDDVITVGHQMAGDRIADLLITFVVDITEQRRCVSGYADQQL